MDNTDFVYSLISWWTFRLFLPVGYCEQCCCEHVCTSSIYTRVLSSLGVIYLRLELLNHMVILCLTSLGIARLSHISCTILLAPPPAKYEFVSLHPHPHLLDHTSFCKSFTAMCFFEGQGLTPMGWPPVVFKTQFSVMSVWQPPPWWWMEKLRLSQMLHVQFPSYYLALTRSLPSCSVTPSDAKRGLSLPFVWLFNTWTSPQLFISFDGSHVSWSLLSPAGWVQSLATNQSSLDGGSK